jgi:aldehyde dehydrogenase (NAD+)
MTDLASSDATSLESAYGELVDNVRAVFRSGRTRPAEWRRGQLKALLALLTEHEAELVEAIQSDLGRPVAEAFVADIGHARLQIKHVLKHFESWMKPKRMSAGFLALRISPGSDGGE